MIRSLLNLWSRRRWRWIASVPVGEWVLLLREDGQQVVARGCYRAEWHRGLCFEDWASTNVGLDDVVCWMPLPRVPHRPVTV